MNRKPAESAAPRKRAGLTIALTLIGVVFFSAASALLVLGKTTAAAGIPFLAAVSCFAGAAWRGAQRE